MSTPIRVDLTPLHPRRERVALMADANGGNPRVVRFTCVYEDCGHPDCRDGNDIGISIPDLDALAVAITAFVSDVARRQEASA